MVDRYGIAETSIPLLSSDITTDLIINQEKESGEVYIAAVYNDQEVKSDTFKITSEVVTYESGNSPVKVGVVEVQEKEEVLDPIDENDRFLPELYINSVYKIDTFSNKEKELRCYSSGRAIEILSRKNRKIEDTFSKVLSVDKNNLSIGILVSLKGGEKTGTIFPILTTFPDAECHSIEELQENFNIINSNLIKGDVFADSFINKGIEISNDNTFFELDIIFKEGTEIYEDIYIDFFSSEANSFLDIKHRLKIEMAVYTFDRSYKIKENEAYIDVVTPERRDLEGPLVLMTSAGIVFKTHSLCRGTGGRNRLNKDADTPIGKAKTQYEPDNGKKNTLSYGKHGVIRLTGIEGEFLKARNKGRSGLLIHSGHTMGHGGVVSDDGQLMITQGCIRVYNSAMEQLAIEYEELIEKGKEIYCYVENYDGNIEDVYHYFNFEIDEKDKKR